MFNKKLSCLNAKKAYVYALIAIGFSVLFTVLAYNYDEYSLLAFIWLLPLTFVFPLLNTRQAFLLGWLWFFLVGGISCLWLYQSAANYLQTSAALLAIIYILLWLWLALPFALFAGLYVKLKLNQSYYEPFLASALLTVIWVYFPSPFPGLPLHALSVMPKFIAVLDLSGISGLLFVTTLFCFAIKQAIQQKYKRVKSAYAVLLILIPLIMLAYGQLRQYQFDVEKQNSNPEHWIKLGYIQPNIDREMSNLILFWLTEQLILQQAPQLIVWPEVTVDYSLTDNSFDKKATFELVEKYQQDLLVASSYVYSESETEGDYFKYYNQAQLVENGKITGTYSKQKLVPFFEYIPDVFSFVKPYFKEYQFYLPGIDQKPLSYANKVSAAVVICYEMIFQDLVREQVKQGANIIINPTSDRRFDGTAGNRFHLLVASFQNISHRVPWLRATNTGYSVIKGADGQLIGQATNTGEMAIRAAEVYLPQQASVFVRYGDWLSKLLLLVLSVYFIKLKRFSATSQALR